MARVLCISSQTVYGPVGNSAAVPALQAEGHEVLQIPTVILSNHPGLGKPAGQSTSAPLLDEMFNALNRIKAFDGLDAVLTGYFASAAQVITAAKQIADLKAKHEKLHVLVDPVIGDNGALYVPQDVAEAIGDRLIPLATITTPNLFELKWLTGSDDVRHRNIIETIVTSVPLGADHLQTILHLSGKNIIHVMQRRSNVPHGTGDYLAGCYLAQRLTMLPEAAFALTMNQLETAINKSCDKAVLNLT